MSSRSFNIKSKLYGIATILCITVFSVCVYMYTLSILSVAAIYSFLMIQTIMIVYSRYIGYLDKKVFIRVGAISFLIICIGYYFAYTTYYYPYLQATKGCSYFDILLHLPSLLNEIDETIFPGTLFFVVFTFLCGMVANKQFMKHEEVNDLNKRLNEFKKEFGMENLEEKDSTVKKSLITLIIVGFITLGLGIFNDYRFTQYFLIKTYKTELSELKEKNKEAYDKAREVLKGQGSDYSYCVDDYYIRGENNTLHIKADLDADEYALYYDCESHGAVLDFVWGDWLWDERKQAYIHTSLDVKAEGEGYAIVYITNDVDDRCIEVFVDNYKY